MDLKMIIPRHDPDEFLFLIIMVLLGLGIAMTFSASAVLAQKMVHDSSFFFKKQLIWAGIGMVLLIGFQYIDYHLYARLTKLLLAISFMLLLVVLIPGLGSAAKGSSRWIRLGFFSLQPSEFVKVAMVIYLAKVFSAPAGPNPIAQFLVPMGVLFLAFLLILLQPDFGTAMDLLVVSVAILFVSGFPLIYILLLFIVSIPTFYLLVYQVEYRRARILGFLDPWQDRFGRGYHIIQSFIAVKKGGLLGTGLGLGTQKLHRLPEPHTDFVFAVIAEEAGMLGTLLVAALYLVFLWRGILIGLRAADDYGRLLAIGLTLLIVVQAFINMGVVSGALPATGIPLPFISYGGSSLLATMAASGILLNISRHRDEITGEFTQEAWQ
jgi:cell division protein FtsW